MVFLFAAAFCVHVAFAQTPLTFASTFLGDSVVVEAGGALVFGSTAPGQGVKIYLAGEYVSSATSDATGFFFSTLPSRPPSLEYVDLLAVDGRNETAAARVKMGRVLICSGQSNAQMPLQGYCATPGKPPCINGTDSGGFGSANGTAEMLAAGAFTGKISIMTLETPFPRPSTWNGTNCGGWPPEPPSPSCTPQPQWNAVTPGADGTVRGFSAVCWYTGKAMFNMLGGTTPIGLIAGSVGGSPIALWLGKDVIGHGGVPADDPICDNAGNITDSLFFDALIAPFAPYTLGAMVWDQGERDVHCFAPATFKTDVYPLWESALIRSWRDTFISPSSAFAAVQLPGYIGDCDLNNADQPLANYSWCVPGVFNMRLAQAAGVANITLASIVPTYDLSCPFGVNTPQCPWGSVHNLIKEPIGVRLAQSLLAALEPSRFQPVSGPTLVSVDAGPTGRGYWNVQLNFDDSTTTQAPTQYCSDCCEGLVGDFDASADGGVTFVNGTLPNVLGSGALAFIVKLPTKPTHIRYTANQGL